MSPVLEHATKAQASETSMHRPEMTMQSAGNTTTSLNLHVGEWVEVRSAAEILATLDESQCVAGLPFMPEMLQYSGKRFRVFKSAHKTPGPIERCTIRYMGDAVHLDDLRCDGSAHGGCQAGCLLFWKTQWLRRVRPGHTTDSLTDGHRKPATEAAIPAPGLDELYRGTRRPTPEGAPELYRCQATEILNATREARRRERWDPRFYIKDLTSGNVALFDFIRFGALAMLNAFLRRWFGLSYPHVRGRAGKRTPTGELNLQPGELVRVRSKHEIEQTLNARRQNRGLWFDAEMVPYCGKGGFRVLRRVEKVVDEKTGAMLRLANPCIVLDGVTCSGRYLQERMFSPKHEPMFFREIWLERVSDIKDHASCR